MSQPVSDSEFRTRLERSRLLSPDVVNAYLAPPQRQSDPTGPPRTLPERLIEERLLTIYQLRQIESGRNSGFYLTDKYKILDFLGAGGMGKVFLCEHLLLHRLVAVKLLHLPEPPDSASPSTTLENAVVERFYREARAAAALDHTNIVRVFDVDRVESGPFMVMEYVDGVSLHDLVARNEPPPIGRAAHYIAQAAAGLAHAHQAGLIHRDVKPANFIVDRAGVVKMLDLGLACFTRDPVRNQAITAQYDQNMLLGTVDYMSPEQATDSSKIDGRSDIYGLGCTMYFLLSGRVPYPGASVMEKLYALQNQAPESLAQLCPHLPREAVAVVDRMMAKTTGERYQTAAEVVAALAPWTAEPIPPPVEREMPRTPASVYRLGLSPAHSGPTAAETRNPNSHAETRRVPRAEPPAATVLASKPMAHIADGSSLVAPTRPRLQGQALAVAGVAGLIVIILASVIGLLIIRGSRPAGTMASLTAPGPAPAAAPPRPFAGVVLRGGGSTFVNPLMERWAAEYETKTGVRIDYQSAGSSKGVQGLTERVFQFGCSDAPMTDAAMAMAGGSVVHIPLVMGAVVPTYNLPEVTEQLRFTGPMLADVYLGKITRWNDPAIRVANPQAAGRLTDMPITVVHRTDGSGTTFIWTDFLSKASGEWRGKLGAKSDLTWPVGVAAKGNNGVATAVSRTVGAIGYVELSYAMENNLRYGRVKNREGKFVQPNLEGVTAAAVASLGAIPADLRYTLADAPGEASYPIVGTVWAVLFADQAGSPAGRDLVAFLHWATHDGQAHAKELRYAPLPPDLVKRIDEKLAEIRVSQ